MVRRRRLLGELHEKNPVAAVLVYVGIALGTLIIVTIVGIMIVKKVSGLLAIYFPWSDCDRLF